MWGPAKASESAKATSLAFQYCWIIFSMRVSEEERSSRDGV